MSMYFAVIVAAFIGSALTFFTGFGLGTILLPIMALFFPLEIAILNTAIVHLANNLWKFRLLYQNINIKVLLSFGMTAFLFSLLGSYLLRLEIQGNTLYRSMLWGAEKEISLLQFTIGFLMIAFALLELFAVQKKLIFDAKYLPLGGAVSGFFGGLSGHQGALRSMFLLRAGLSKEGLIATGTCIALLVDGSRLFNYYGQFKLQQASLDYVLISLGVAAALLGVSIGNYYFKKIQLPLLERIVALGILLIGLSLLK
jgi:uncharacterized protein